MKFTLSWLKEFLDTSADIFTLCDTLTHLGHEVESVENKGAGLHDFVVAEILEASRHPDSERLHVCKVKAAQGELQIVCGAPNARAGIKVALANIGTVIPTNGMEIKPSKIRGVESQGMLCSARELGIGSEDAGIMELASDAPIGESIVDLLGLNDPVIDLSITANRGDCMSIYGIARELAAKGVGTLQSPSPHTSHDSSSPHPNPLPKGEGVSIALHTPAFCPAFIGRRITGVKNTASPEWLQQRLISVGLRPISALVDITNYMTLSFGRPLHVYDLAKLKGGIQVRAAKAGETLAALNDKSYTLADGMCVIADDSGVIGLGGIVGGTSTGVDETTRDLLLECAYFTPEQIGKTGRALGVDSDARARFERGIDPEFMAQGVEIATQMILELCGGTAEAPTLAGAIPTHNKEIRFSPDAVNALGGTSLPRVRMEQHLKALGCVVAGDIATSPSWRSDMSQPADLAEEILRLEGYDSLPAVSLPKPALSATRSLNNAQLRISRCRRLLAARGLHEAQCWGFISPQDAAHFVAQDASLALRNAISSELSVMRSSLLPHLVRAVANNQARGRSDVHLFEIGAVFGVDKPLYQETAAALVRVGDLAPLSWQGNKAADMFSAKSDMEALLAECGMDAAKVTLKPENLPRYYHPGRAAALMLGPKNLLGYVGELHPRIAEAYGVTGRAVAVELFLDRVPMPKSAKRRALKRSDFQSASRDFAFVVDAALPAASLLKAAAGADTLLVRELALFDVYQGKNLDAAKKSLGLRVTLQADDRTLTDAEIDAVSQAIITAAQALGAVLR